MGFDAITIARQAGAGGERIAARVVEELGYQLLDVEIVRRAAAAAGVSTETIEKSEHAPTFLERILRGLALGSVSPLYNVGSYPVLEAVPALTDERYRELTEEVLRKLAVRGQVVILGHAGHMALQNFPKTLKVLIHAPLEFRTSSLAAEAGLSAEEARGRIEGSDKDRERFFSTYYGVRWLDAQLYDLAINTCSFAPEEAAQIIIDAVGPQGG